MKRRLVTAVVCLLALAPVGAANDEGGLKRAGVLGARLRDAGGKQAGAEVGAVSGGAAQAAGLQAGDRVLTINGKKLSSEKAAGDSVAALRAGELVRLEVSRGGRTLALQAVAPPVPKENLAGVSTIYGSVANAQGQRVRTIVTRPAGASGKLPAVFLAPWLSCNTVETRPENPASFQRVLQMLATQSGMVFMRVDKPGAGDSEGVCSETDFESELSGYRAAFEALRRDAGVDPERIFIFGMSNGGGFAPLVPGDAKVAGYVLQGGWAKTWYEHMIEHERRRLTLSGRTPGEVSADMKAYAELYTLFLVKRMNPSEIVRTRPHLKNFWYGEGDTLYGRPAKFHMGLQALNLAEAWAKVSAPVLAIHGEHDWIMSADDPRMIVDWVNRNAPGKGRLELVSRMDHDFSDYASAEAAFRDEGGRFNQRAAQMVVDWLKAQAGQR